MDEAIVRNGAVMAVLMGTRYYNNAGWNGWPDRRQIQHGMLAMPSLIQHCTIIKRTDIHTRQDTRKFIIHEPSPYWTAVPLILQLESQIRIAIVAYHV
jgi:hypothetical protein